MKSFAPLSVFLAALLLGACSSAPDQYFRLSATGPAPVRSSGLAVGVGPVTLPGYVNRPELVFQTSDNEFQVPAKAHWTGTLQENFTRVLADDLGRRLHSGAVVALPWPGNTKLTYQVTVDVRQFHAISGGEAILEASWQVENPDSRAIVHRRNGSFSVKIVGDGYGPVVAAESQLLDRLAGAIANSL